MDVCLTMFQATLSFLTSIRNKRLLSESRAQTLNDFALGTSIFLFTVLFVFAFVPSIFAPFSLQVDTGDSIRVDRSAEYLTQSVLTDSDKTMTLDSDCTEAFFSNTTVSGCDYSPASLDTILGYGDNYQSVNVTIRTQSGTLATSNSVELARGDTPSHQQQTTAISRIVLLDGETHQLVVQTW